MLAGEGGGVKVETSFQGAGKLVGVDTIELGTYESTMTPSGHLHGEGQGTSMSPTGDMAINMIRTSRVRPAGSTSAKLVVRLKPKELPVLQWLDGEDLQADLG